MSTNPDLSEGLLFVVDSRNLFLRSNSEDVKLNQEEYDYLSGCSREVRAAALKKYRRAKEHMF